MSIHSDEWLAGIIGYPVYRLDASREAGDARAALAAHLAAGGSRAMYYTKVDTGEVAIARDLTALGMYVVDVNVTLGLDGTTAVGTTSRATSASIAISDCDAAAASGALAIAGSAMQYSRFHLDPAIPVAVAHRIKHDWIENYVRGARGEALMIARLGSEVAGFLAVLTSRSHGRVVRTIDLIAVALTQQRRGVGRALVDAFVARYAPSSDLLQVGTQVVNAPSLALYQGAGFTIRHSAYVLHLHTAAVPSPTA